MAKQKATKVIELLELVWSGSLAATGHSWERLNRSMRQALELAISSGFEFTKADFVGLDKFRPGYWMGASSEWCYSLAITEGNSSAAAAYEEWVGREPIIADGVNGLQKERLHVGARFVWAGEKVKATSFTKDGAAVACSYHPPGDGDDREGKIKKRYTVTREAVFQERAERKQRDAILAELGALKITNGAIDFAKEFGTKDMKVVRAMPFKKFVKIANAIKAKAA